VTYISPDFMTHASPEAIESAIREAEATRDRYAKKVSVLRGLLATRHDQIAAGTWPTARTATARTAT
jgi:ClpP class serine protease